VFFCTSFCNHSHSTISGKPLGHECYVLPPHALRAERAGDIEEALRLMSASRPLRVHPGVRCRHEWERRTTWDRWGNATARVTCCAKCGREKR
jgi:hypothetical protein